MSKMLLPFWMLADESSDGRKVEYLKQQIKLSRPTKRNSKIIFFFSNPKTKYK
jgi:hypothetical protein